jgi:hypothetical protein
MQPHIRIYVDFNTMMMDKEERVYIGNEDSQQDSQTLLGSVEAGMLVTLYDEELEVDAIVDVVQSEKGQRIWLGKPDWSTRRDLLPLALSTSEQV